MPVRGKILNCLKADYPRIFKSEIITDLMKVLGCGVEVHAILLIRSLKSVFAKSQYIAAYRLIGLYSDSIRRVTFMFNAIDNDDFTFRFHEDPSKVDNGMALFGNKSDRTTFTQRNNLVSIIFGNGSIF